MKYGEDNLDNQVLMLNYINVLPNGFESLTDDDLSSSNIWIAALEKILFNQSQKTIIYSDLYESEDFLKSHESMPVYDIEKFNSLQAEFLMKSKEERILYWTLCSS